jgi:hypothetical protein
MNAMIHRQRFSTLLLLTTLLAPLVLTAPALDQDVATAEALFNRGFADMEAGCYETGCKAIAVRRVGDVK